VTNRPPQAARRGMKQMRTQENFQVAGNIYSAGEEKPMLSHHLGRRIGVARKYFTKDVIGRVHT
jgi:hypothetical protein